MHVARSNHASCTLGSKAYFFGGLDSNQNRLSSIEWFDLVSGDRCEAPIDPDDDTKARRARELPCFAPISEFDFVIMGGLGDQGKMSDVLKFSTNSGGGFSLAQADTGISFVCKSQSGWSKDNDDNPIGGMLSLVKSSNKGNCIVSYLTEGGFSILGSNL